GGGHAPRAAKRARGPPACDNVNVAVITFARTAAGGRSVNSECSAGLTSPLTTPTSSTAPATAAAEIGSGSNQSGNDSTSRPRLAQSNESTRLRYRYETALPRIAPPPKAAMIQPA